MDVFNSIFDIIYFYIFNHTSCGKHNVSGYVFQEANTIGVHEVTSYGEFLVSVKDDLAGIWYYGIFLMLYLVSDCFALKIWHTGSIDVLSHPNIFSQNWEVLKDVIINYM